MSGASDMPGPSRPPYDLDQCALAHATARTNNYIVRLYTHSVGFRGTCLSVVRTRSNPDSIRIEVLVWTHLKVS